MLRGDYFSNSNTEQKQLSFEGTGENLNRVWAQLTAVYRPTTSWPPRSSNMILGMYGISINRHGAAIETSKWFAATSHQLRTSALRGMLFVLGLARRHYITKRCLSVVNVTNTHKRSPALTPVRLAPLSSLCSVPLSVVIVSCKAALATR